MKYWPVLVVALLSALPVAAQQDPQTHEGMKGMGMQDMPGMAMQDMTPPQKEYHESMQKMDGAMMQGMMEKDPATAWLKQMIAHHQGAIDMSEVVLKHSKNEQVLKAARKTKEQNEKDKKELEAMLR